MHNNHEWTKLAPLATLLLFALGTDVYACTCRERQPPCAQYGSADVVFVGSVVKITMSNDMPRHRIDFSVKRGVKGFSGTTAQLVGYGTSCDYGFREGETYLVYALRNSERNELYTHYCTRTTELSNAGSDLAFLDLPLDKRQSPQIMGVLAENDARLPKINVVASSGGRKYRTTTGKDGWFRLNVPRPGKYRVRVTLPHYADVVGTGPELSEISKRVRTRTSTILEYEVVVEPDRCGLVNPPLFIDYLEYRKHQPRRASSLTPGSPPNP